MSKVIAILILTQLLFCCQESKREINNEKTTENSIICENFKVQKIQLVKFAGSEVLWVDSSGNDVRRFTIDSSKFEFENDVVQLQVFPTKSSQFNIVIPFSRSGSNKIVIKKLKLDDESVPMSMKFNNFKVGYLFSGNEYLNLYESFFEGLQKNRLLNREKEVDSNRMYTSYLEGLKGFVEESNKSQVGGHLLMIFKSFIQSMKNKSWSKDLLTTIDEISSGGKGVYELAIPNTSSVGGFNGECIDYPIDTLVFQANNSIIQFGEDDIVVLDFWATWCKPCISGLKYLDSLKANQFKDEKVSFIGVSIDNDMSKSFDFLHKITNNVLSYFDSGGCMKDIYNITSVPQVFIYDQNRRLRYANVPKDSISYYVNLLLEKK